MVDSTERQLIKILSSNNKETSFHNCCNTKFKRKKPSLIIMKMFQIYFKNSVMISHDQYYDWMQFLIMLINHADIMYIHF